MGGMIATDEQLAPGVVLLRLHDADQATYGDPYVGVAVACLRPHHEAEIKGLVTPDFGKDAWRAIARVLKDKYGVLWGVWDRRTNGQVRRLRCPS